VTARILIGTASWKDHEPFYPPDVTATERLSWYAERLPYGEIDSSLYRVPGHDSAGTSNRSDHHIH
jgi:uncharacterized protein YecE (DUF72 family)